MSSIPSLSESPRRLNAAWLIAWIVAVTVIVAATLADARPRREPRVGPLETSLSTRYDEAGRPVVTVTVGQPYRALVFTRGEAGDYASELRVTVIARRDGRQVAGAVRSIRTTSGDAEGTRTETRLTCSVPVPLDDDRPVKLDIRAEVVGTSRWWHRELEYAPGGGGIPWYFTSFAWNLTNDGAGILSLEQRVDSLRVDVGLGLRPGGAVGSGATRFIAAVRDAQGTERILSVKDLPLPGDSDSLSIRVAAPASEFPFGLQTLAIRLEGDHEARLELSPDHELVNLGVPFLDDTAWRRHVGWLDEIVPDKADRRTLAEMPPDSRAAAWHSLWEARGPDLDPDEAGHLERIVEADRRFGRFGRGALSDRGRILIRYGRPDKVDYHGMEPNVSGEWEVWYYRQIGVRVVFYDPYALGDYRLYAELPY